MKKIDARNVIVRYDWDTGFEETTVEYLIRDLHKQIACLNMEVSMLNHPMEVPRIDNKYRGIEQDLKKVEDVMREYLLCDINDYEYQTETKLVKIKKEK